CSMTKYGHCGPLRNAAKPARSEASKKPSGTLESKTAKQDSRSEIEYGRRSITSSLANCAPRIKRLADNRTSRRVPNPNMQAFKITLEYDGSKFSGWQSQLNARSVQGELQRVARELIGDGVEIQGAGRTDAGVHALGQVAHIKLKDSRKKFR